MLRLAVLLLTESVLFGGLAVAAGGVAKFVFFLFMLMALIFFVLYLIRIVERLIQQLFCCQRQIRDFQPLLQFTARVVL